MDTATLRVVFALIGVVLLVLFYVAAYRTTRAAYAGWWTLTLLGFTLGSAAYLANGTSAQAVLNPLGNAIAVTGAEAAFCASRSLFSGRPRWRLLAIAPLATLIAGLADHPDRSTWSGGLVFLIAMAVMFLATAFELVRAAENPPDNDPSYVFLTRVLATGAAILGAYYLARAVVFASYGPYSHTFTTWFGTAGTTVLLIVLLVAVSFSMSSLTSAQQMSELRRQATHDSLTGLPNRREYLRSASMALQAARRSGRPAAVAMGDLDHFKRINDAIGHAGGDAVLRAFATSAQDMLHQGDVVARIGGEEFAVLLPDTDLDAAQRVLEHIGEAFGYAAARVGAPEATVSFGLAASVPAEDLAMVLERADAALYRAKEAGRARVVRAS
jgi:diguanylate cyclase (GGDEF)-like protein